MKYFSAELATKLGQFMRNCHSQKKFITSITHDLRTPLAGARMGVESVLMHLQGLQQMKLKRVLQNIDRVDQMVKDLLDVNRLQAGEVLFLDHQKHHLNEMIEDVVSNLNTIYGQRFMIEGVQDIWGVWCRKSLCRILENLLLNALKYGDDGAPITIKASEINGHLCIDVHNCGNPIAIEDQVHLFKQFKRLDAVHNKHHDGWGLGLSLVKWLTEAHHGYVGVTSSETEGTTFSVHLPIDSTQNFLRIDEVEKNKLTALQ